MKYKIYKLLLDEQVVYVGRTKTSLMKRKSAGYNHTGYGELLKQSTIELIEETDDVSRERYWIKYYRDLGINLLNKYNGDGFDKKKWNDNYYLTLKEYHRNYKNSEKYILYCNSQHYKELRKELSKKYIRSSEQKARKIEWQRANRAKKKNK